MLLGSAIRCLVDDSKYSDGCNFDPNAVHNKIIIALKTELWLKNSCVIYLPRYRTRELPVNYSSWCRPAVSFFRFDPFIVDRILHTPTYL